MRKTRKIHTKVAGVTKKNEDNESIQDILEDLSGVDVSSLPLELEHEYDNPHDENAIKVYVSYQHIGYLKRSLAEDLSNTTDSDLSGSVIEITGGDDGCNYGCNILVKVEESEPVKENAYKRTVRQNSDGVTKSASPRESSDSSYKEKGIEEAVKNKWLYLIFCVAFAVSGLLLFAMENGGFSFVGILCMSFAVVFLAKFIQGMWNS